MTKQLGLILMLVGAASFAMAQQPAPEVGAGSAGTALALVSGALLIIRGRRKK